MNILVIKPKMPMTQLTRANEFLLLFSLIIVLALAAVFLIVLSRPGAHLRPPTFQERWDALPGVDRAGAHRKGTGEPALPFAHMASRGGGTGRTAEEPSQHARAGSRQSCTAVARRVAGVGGIGYERIVSLQDHGGADASLRIHLEDLF